jgi:hypothetical protein
MRPTRGFADARVGYVLAPTRTPQFFRARGSTRGSDRAGPAVVRQRLLAYCFSPAPWWRWVFVALLALLIVPLARLFAEGIPTPVGLMEKAQSYFKDYESFRGTWVVTYARFDREGRGEGRTWEVLKDGLKAKVIVHATTPAPFRPPEDAESLPKRVLERLEKRHNERYGRKEFITIPGERNLHVFAPDALLDEVDPKEETASRIIGNTPFALCYGYLEFEPILDLLQAMDLTAEVAQLDGSEAHLLSGQSRDGDFRIQIWFDPGCEYVIRQIEYERRLPDRGMPARFVKVIHKQSGFQRRGGVLTPTTAERTVIRPAGPKLFREDGKTVTRRDGSGKVIMEPEDRSVVFQELQSLDYSPTFVAADFQPSVPIEQGAPVQMQDARQLQYEWKDGKAVPVVPDVPTGQEFIQEGRPTGRFLMVVAGIVLMALVAVMLYRPWKRKLSEDQASAAIDE